MNNQEIKDFYNSMLKKRVEDFVIGNERVSRAYDEISKLIQIYKPKKILEIGCGIGDISFKIAEQFPLSEIIGFDISKSTIDFGKNIFKMPNFNLVYCNDFIELNEFIENEEFDFIFLIDVFEHLDDQNKNSFIDFLKKKMNKNSLIFFSCPTILHQNYLRNYNPEGLQPIDNDVSLVDFINLADSLELELLYYKVISVWNYSDYQHTVIGKLAISGHFSDKLVFRKKGIKDMLRERFLMSKKEISEYSKIREQQKILFKERGGE